MANSKPTTTNLTMIQVDVQTRDIYKALAKRNMRSIKAHLAWLAQREYFAEFGKPPVTQGNGNEPEAQS